MNLEQLLNPIPEGQTPPWELTPPRPQPLHSVDLAPPPSRSRIKSILPPLEQLVPTLTHEKSLLSRPPRHPSPPRISPSDRSHQPYSFHPPPLAPSLQHQPSTGREPSTPPAALPPDAVRWLSALTTSESQKELWHNCEVCSRSFMGKGKLARHMAVHDTPFRCQACARRFSTKDLLEVHRETAKH